MLAQWATATIPLFSTISLGRGDGTWLRDFSMLSLRGVLGAVGVAAVLFGVDHFTGANYLWWPVLVLGAFEGVAYTIGWTQPIPTTDNGFNAPTEIGEILYGALLGLGLVIGLTA